MTHTFLPEVTTDAEFSSMFNDPTFGIDAARILCSRHGYSYEPLRVVDGANLNFRVGDGHWLKICPPTNADDGATERWMLEHVAGKLSVPTPELTAAGELDGWEYLF